MPFNTMAARASCVVIPSSFDILLLPNPCLASSIAFFNISLSMQFIFDTLAMKGKKWAKLNYLAHTNLKPKSSKLFSISSK
jgi:hypothetical protein